MKIVRINVSVVLFLASVFFTFMNQDIAFAKTRLSSSGELHIDFKYANKNNLKHKWQQAEFDEEIIRERAILQFLTHFHQSVTAQSITVDDSEIASGVIKTQYQSLGVLHLTFIDGRYEFDENNVLRRSVYSSTRIIDSTLAHQDFIVRLYDEYGDIISETDSSINYGDTNIKGAYTFFTRWERKRDEENRVRFLKRTRVYSTPNSIGSTQILRMRYDEYGNPLTERQVEQFGPGGPAIVDLVAWSYKRDVDGQLLQAASVSLNTWVMSNGNYANFEKSTRVYNQIGDLVQEKKRWSHGFTGDGHATFDEFRVITEEDHVVTIERNDDGEIVNVTRDVERRVYVEGVLKTTSTYQLSDDAFTRGEHVEFLDQALDGINEKHDVLAAQEQGRRGTEPQQLNPSIFERL